MPRESVMSPLGQVLQMLEQVTKEQVTKVTVMVAPVKETEQWKLEEMESAMALSTFLPLRWRIKMED